MHEALYDYAYGMWSLVALTVILVVAFALSYFAPKKKVEWRSMGVLAAWVVALFTEMYGFPLTIRAARGTRDERKIRRTIC